MNLRRQLLLVSVLTLSLPWAGFQFIRETESALRAGQQQMLAGTARAVADSLAQYREEFVAEWLDDPVAADQLYGHRLDAPPTIDGYFDDWLLDRAALRVIPGVDGPIRLVFGLYEQSVYLYVEVADRAVVYTAPGAAALDEDSRYSDRVTLVSTSPPYRAESLSFAAEAPGPILTYVSTAYGFSPEPSINALWQDVPGGYQVEARIPISELGTNLGVVVRNTATETAAPVRSATYTRQSPGPFVATSPELTAIADALVQPGMRLLITDAAGWRIAQTGSLPAERTDSDSAGSAWLRLVYNALVESGERAALAEPDQSGREQQSYISRALQGSASVSWFRSAASGKAVVAAAEPIRIGDRTVGSVILQQGTDAILSLTNQGLSRLINATVIATVLVAFALLGYASWLSRRIRRLSRAAERALDSKRLDARLPSASAGDEIGDLSRSFSHVLRQLGDYNEYLRSLASKLSHELRTPLAIVTSSLENLEHETLGEAAVGYARRARDGADRLRRVLSAMSEASRVEELMQAVEAETFSLAEVLSAAVDAYRDVYPQRKFEFDCGLASSAISGSPELIVQLLDKLVDNAVEFSADGDTVTVQLGRQGNELVIRVENPGPALPERMRARLFDSMVSVRPKGPQEHLGLGLYIAKLIADGHGGTIDAQNTDNGVAFLVRLPSNA
jgi:dedicated sortase system histidine kinase